MRLIPRERKFFRMFSEVSENLTDGARLLHDILKNPNDLTVRIGRLQEIEHRGDEMTHDIIRMLNQTFITPFDREDIHRLSSSLDDVLDFVNGAAVRITIGETPVWIAGLAFDNSQALQKTIRSIPAR